MIIGLCQLQNNTEELSMNSCDDVQASAVTALGLVNILGTRMDSRSCVENGISFLCNSIAVLCGNVSGSSMLTEECIEVRDNDCAIEWRIAANLIPNVSIPDCNSFDDGANLTFSKVAPPETCLKNYDVFCETLCLPICGEVSPYSDTLTDFHHVWSILMVSISLVGTTVAFVAFFLKRETM